MLITTREAAERIGVPIRTLQRYAKTIGLPQHGGSFMIDYPSIAFDQLSAMAKGRIVRKR